MVFEDCAKPGGLHQQLLPFAILGLCAYSIGYPVGLFVVLYRKRYAVMEDQLLRAEDRGATPLENPNAFRIRKMYHKYEW